MLPTLFAGLCLVALGDAAPAKPNVPIDRRSRDEPEMSVRAGGRTGTCDALFFSPDGKILYAGGDDKIVNRWTLKEGKLVGDLQPLLWPGWREQRGGVKAVAVPANAGDRRVLVAGYGMKDALVVLLNKDGEIEGTNDIPGLKLPKTNVMAITFTPDGKSAVYGTADGLIWRWDLDKGNRAVTEQTGAPPGMFNRPRLLRFLDDKTLLCVRERGDVTTFDLTTLPATVTQQFQVQDRLNAELPPRNPKPAEINTYRADLTADGKWLAVAVQKYVVLCEVAGPATKLIPAEPYPRAIAFDADGRLAVAKSHLNDKLFCVEGDDEIAIYADALTAVVPTVSATLKHTFRAEALAWGAGGLLAVAGGDNHEITLWDVKKPAAPLEVVRGKGRGIWGVRIGKADDSFLFRVDRDPTATDPNARARGAWLGFDFVKGQPLLQGRGGRTLDETATVPVVTTADGWRVDPQENGRVWYAVLEEGGAEVARHKLPIDLDRDEQPRCYCFLAAKGKKPTRLLVGHYYGFSEFTLTKTDIVRSLLATGQAGDVMSIAASADQSWVVTSGLDQTVAGWSLADWSTGPFGATLAIDGDRLMVAAIDAGGPAWEMGLSVGDEIVMTVRTSTVENKPKHDMFLALPGDYLAGKIVAKTGSAEAAKDALQRPIFGLEYYLGWKTPGGVLRENKSTVRRRPLWRFFPGFDAEGSFAHWVAWMWKGSFYATSTSGDSLVGWQVNDPTIHERQPKFYVAERFRDALNQEVPVLQLMQTRDLKAALLHVLGQALLNPVFGKREPAPAQLILANKVVGPAGLSVDIRVKARDSNPDLLPQRVELWVNDHQVEGWNAGGAEVKTTVVIPDKAFRAGANRVTLLTLNSAGGRGEQEEWVTSARAESPPRVLGLLVGINDYSKSVPAPGGGRGVFGDLTKAENDAQKLFERWRSHAGKGRLYESENLVVIAKGKQASQKEIFAALDRLAKEAQPEDRVIVFFAGHGDFVTNAASGDSEFVFCCPDYDPKKYKETGVTGDELMKRLAKCPARKLVLLDACHSGQAARTNMVRQLVPKNRGPMIIAACDRSEYAYENPKGDNGLFTAAVLEALGEAFDKADGSGTGKADGLLDPRELFHYVRRRLPGLLADAGKPGQQHPQMFPPELELDLDRKDRNQYGYAIALRPLAAAPKGRQP